MGDYREIEVIILVIGTTENTMTEEPGNKIVPVRKKILMKENLTVEEIAQKFAVAATNIEAED